MTGFIEHIAKRSREEVYMKTFQWILKLPNFILSMEQKLNLVARLFEKDVAQSKTIETSFDKDLEHLKIVCEEHSIYFLGIQQYRKDPDFYIDVINLGATVGILYENDSPDNLRTDSVLVISYTKLIRELSRLSAKDCKTQYFIEDFIEGIENHEKVEGF
jgi:hypothetical protein